MRTRPISKPATGAALGGTMLLTLFASGVVCAEPAHNWSFSLTPYLWAAGIENSLRLPLPSGDTLNADVEVDFDDIIENLDLGLMLAGEARRDRLFVFSDLIYMKISHDGDVLRSVERTGPNAAIPVTSSLEAGTDSTLESWVWTLAAGYDVVRSDRATLGVFGGVRYLALDAEVDWRLTAAITAPGAGVVLGRTGSASSDGEHWDGIVGVRGRARLGGGDWFMPYYADVGSGDTDFTWQAMVGVGYTFSWGEALLVYRHLDWDQDGDEAIQGLTISGPALGVTMRF